MIEVLRKEYDSHMTTACTGELTDAHRQGRKTNTRRRCSKILINTTHTPSDRRTRKQFAKAALKEKYTEYEDQVIKEHRVKHDEIPCFFQVALGLRIPHDPNRCNHTHSAKHALFKPCHSCHATNSQWMNNDMTPFLPSSVLGQGQRAL